jgi:hypothetical protein
MAASDQRITDPPDEDATLRATTERTGAPRQR